LRRNLRKPAHVIELKHLWRLSPMKMPRFADNGMNMSTLTGPGLPTRQKNANVAAEHTRYPKKRLDR